MAQHSSAFTITHQNLTKLVELVLQPRLLGHVLLNLTLFDVGSANPSSTFSNLPSQNFAAAHSKDFAVTLAMLKQLGITAPTLEIVPEECEFLMQPCVLVSGLRHRYKWSES